MFNFLWFFKTKKKEEPENVVEDEYGKAFDEAASAFAVKHDSFIPNRDKLNSLVNAIYLQVKNDTENAAAKIIERAHQQAANIINSAKTLDIQEKQNRLITEAKIEADGILRKARKDASKYLAAVKKQCEVCANG